MKLRCEFRTWPLCLLAATFFACATTAPHDSCAFLTPAELEQVQGERPVETKSTQEGKNQQCFYRLPTFSKSISLSIQYDAREFWEEQVHGERNEREEEEHESRAEPRQIEGVGDEARWVATPVGGILYVLKDDAMLLISIGGGDTDAVRLEKATALARKALRRVR